MKVTEDPPDTLLVQPVAVILRLVNALPSPLNAVAVTVPDTLTSTKVETQDTFRLPAASKANEVDPAPTCKIFVPGVVVAIPTLSNVYTSTYLFKHTLPNLFQSFSDV